MSDGTIKGIVIGDDLNPIGYTIISLLSGSDSVTVIKSTLTDEQGRYKFDKLTGGKYIIAVNATTWQKRLVGPLDLKDTGVITADITLVHKTKDLAAVTVIATKPLIEQKIDKTVLNIENSTLAAGNSLLEILKKAPGVTIDKDGEISMNGKSGVNILIDGKSTYLSGEQLTALLQSMQGTSVERIDLITNPSAKYDAAGAAGIINIHPKKNTNHGTNSTIILGGGYGQYPKSNGSISINHRIKHFNFFGSYSYDANKFSRDLHIDRLNQSANVATYFGEQTNVILNNTSNTYKAGIDYYINNKNILGIVFNSNKNSENDQTNSNTYIGRSFLNTDSSVQTNNPTNKKFSYAAFDLNYRSILDTQGQELDVTIDYNLYTNNSRNIYNNYFYDAEGKTNEIPSFFKSNAPTDIKIFAAKIDYTCPLGADFKLETGIKTSYVHTDNTILYDDLINGAWQNDITRSNEFIYTESINAAYINFQKKFKKIDIEAGLRAEQSNSSGNSITTQSIVNRQYLDLFPSLFLQRKLSGDHAIRVAYTKRISRPNYTTLNPFVYNFDYYTFEKGNPYLDPQYINSYDITYMHKANLYINIGYSQVNNAIKSVTITDTINKTLYVTNLNLAKQRSWYCSINYSIPITKWWNSYNNLTAYYNKFSTPDLSGTPFTSGKGTYHISTNQTCTINPSTSMEVSIEYISPGISGTYLTNSIYYVDLGIKKVFDHKRANIKFAVDDVFNTHQENISSVVPGQYYHIYQKWETRIFRLMLSYRFGGNATKTENHYSKSSADEDNRAKF